MADYKPEGEGAHPTLAGNTLDPNVNADGAVGGAHGQGVGGTSESRIREEGLEHIKAHSDAGGAPLGESSTAPSTEPQSKGILGTVKEYLGYGASSEQPREAGEGIGAGHDTSVTGGTLGSGVGEPTTGNTLGSDTRDTTDVGGAPASGALGGRETSAVDAEPSTTETSVNKGLGTDPADRTAPRDLPTDSDVTTGGDPTESADPTTKNTAVSGSEQARDDNAGGAGEYNPDKGLDDAHTGHLRENKSAIPSAGGEKLGERHWGESKIVPDNPKPAAEEAGVSSEEGQPTSQVRDNTNANTGGAKPPGQSSSTGDDPVEKEKLSDKIKNKLHIGHKNKS